MSRIGIDLGHGANPYDRGANGFIAEEEIINYVGGLVINKLRTLGHEVIECRPNSCSNVGDSLSQRVQRANNNNVDLFVSIHANAGGGQGTEVFTYGARQLSQAVNVLNNIVALGFRNRGIKDSKNVAYVVNHTNAPAMLIEVCFVDTQSDVNKYRSIGAEKIADAIVKGLVGESIKVNNASQPVQKQSQPQSNNNGLVYSATVRDFQRQFNETYGNVLQVDGLWGENTEKALHKVLIKQGMSNSLVGFIQCRVGAEVDYDFGSNTKAKVMEYQHNHNLSADGIVGFNTIKCILNQYK